MAPVFDPDVADAVQFLVGQAITTIQIPAATWRSCPRVYTAAGLPAGLSFDATARTITGTPYDSGHGHYHHHGHE